MPQQAQNHSATLPYSFAREIDSLVDGLKDLNEKFDEFRDEQLKKAVEAEGLRKDVEYLLKEREEQREQIRINEEKRDEEINALNRSIKAINRILLPILGIGILLSFLGQTGFFNTIIK